MSNNKSAKSLDEMLQSDRKKRKAEALAQEIFGKNRRQNAPVAKPITTAGASFASRVGITKRSASSSSVGRPKPAQRPNAPSALGRSATAGRQDRAAAANGAHPAVPREPMAHIKGRSGRGGNGEINIRGAAGPYTVIAQNFAPGTTAADIESVMQPIGGDLVSCRLVTADPTVIAEMAFVDRQGAENVIATFNNKKADGRLLYVYMKDGEPQAASAPTIEEPIVHDLTPTAPPPVEPVDTEMEVDRGETEQGYREDRMRREEHARSSRDDRPSNRYRDDRGRGPPAYQDGRYGFGNAPNGPRYDSRRDEGSWRGDDRRMYSDRMRGGRSGW